MAAVGGHLGHESLEQALAGKEQEELMEMGRRLVQSRAGFEHALADMEAEQQELQDENARLHNAIKQLMAELNSKDINAINLAPPQLEEGPLDFVGRFWERVRPRDSVVIVNDHVGEIRKSAVTQGASKGKQLAGRLASISGKLSHAAGGLTSPRPLSGRPFEGTTPQELGMHMAESGKKLGKRLSGALTFLSKSTGDRHHRPKPKKLDSPGSDGVRRCAGSQPPAAKATTPADAGAAQSPQAPAPLGGLLTYFLHPGQKPDVGPSSSGPGEPDLPESAFKPSPPRVHGEPADIRDSGGVVQTLQLSGEQPPQPESPSHGAAGGGVACTAGGGSTASANGSSGTADIEGASETANIEEVAPESVAKEDDLSSLLIEVQLELDDGDVATCQVRASDRVKVVAENFIRDHSLKRWFEEPLRSYLTKVEAEAETFPVKLRANLMEMREQHAAAKL